MKTTAYRYGVETVNGQDAWALFVASAVGDIAAAKALLAKDRRLVNAQYWYQFPIHRAVAGGRAAVVKLLLEHGADPGQSRSTYDSWDKLLRTAKDRGYDDVAALLQRAMHRRFRYAPEFGALKDAIIARNARQIAAVLKKQPELATASDALGNNALHWSVLTRQLDLIRQFVERGTPIDAHRADGHTPVLLAVNGATDYWYRNTRGRSHPSLRNSSVLVGSLLALGAEYTLSIAVAVGDQERVEALLRKDAGLAARLDSARIRPLTYAAREGHEHLVRLLLERGADPNLAEENAPDGRALYDACCRNHPSIVERLLQHGANPNAGVDSCECCVTIGRIYHGDRAKPVEVLLRKFGAQTPPYALTTPQLQQALRDDLPVVRHEEFVDVILQRRNAKLWELFLDSNPGKEWLRSADGATYPSSPRLVRQLLDRGFDPNRPDWLGRTALHTCAENGNQTIAALFLAAGADINARDIDFFGTPLATAVRCGALVADADPPRLTDGSRRMIEFLLKRGAAVNLPDDKPWATPLAWARKRRLRDVEVELLRLGAT
jgi:ankyrin repeat protein